MSFVIRAALVIGALSWLALQRQGAGTPELSAGPSGLTGAALAAWETLPNGTREAALREGGAELTRRASALATAPSASRDTLVESDRKLPWRGAHTRADPN